MTMIIIREVVSLPALREASPARCAETLLGTMSLIEIPRRGYPPEMRSSEQTNNNY